MHCPDCDKEMESIAEFCKITDIVEFTTECPNCKTMFHGTLYRAAPVEIPENTENNHIGAVSGANLQNE